MGIFKTRPTGLMTIGAQFFREKMLILVLYFLSYTCFLCQKKKVFPRASQWMWCMQSPQVSLLLREEQSKALGGYVVKTPQERKPKLSGLHSNQRDLLCSVHVWSEHELITSSQKGDHDIPANQCKGREHWGISPARLHPVLFVDESKGFYNLVEFLWVVSLKNILTSSTHP